MQDCEVFTFMSKAIKRPGMKPICLMPDGVGDLNYQQWCCVYDAHKAIDRVLTQKETAFLIEIAKNHINYKDLSPGFMRVDFGKGYFGKRL